MGALSGRDIEAGDIFLCKSFSVRMNGTHLGIRAGQFLADDMLRSNTVHAQIAVTTGAADARVIESTNAGVTEVSCDVEADVFRLRRAYPGAAALAAGAAQVAKDLRDWAECRKTSGGQPAGHYNLGRSMASVVRFAYLGSEGKSLAEKVGGALDSGGTYEDGFYCSMLAVICYQVAAIRAKLPAPPIERDAMNMNPAALHRYLRAHKEVWACVGIYNRPAGGNALSRWAERLGRREH